MLHNERLALSKGVILTESVSLVFRSWRRRNESYWLQYSAVRRRNVRVRRMLIGLVPYSY
jgi:hypothetical protein